MSNYRKSEGRVIISKKERQGKGFGEAHLTKAQKTTVEVDRELKHTEEGGVRHSSKGRCSPVPVSQGKHTVFNQGSREALARSFRVSGQKMKDRPEENFHKTQKKKESKGHREAGKTKFF